MVSGFWYAKLDDEKVEESENENIFGGKVRNVVVGLCNVTSKRLHNDEDLLWPKISESSWQFLNFLRLVKDQQEVPLFLW